MLILASQSPRRQELLKLITEHFSVILSETDEALPPKTQPDAAVRLLAERKAAAVFAEHPGDIVIGADTLVACGGEVLGKPRDAADARRMLTLLSGRTHSVFTGVSVLSPGISSVFVEESLVSFHTLAPEQIERYIVSGEPMDKAGAYGIQGKAALFVRRIEGDYFNIVGLPISRLYQNLLKIPAFCVMML